MHGRPCSRGSPQRGLDGVTLLVLPAVLFVLLLFVYPFLYGLVLSFKPKKGGWLANYRNSSPIRSSTARSATTLWLAHPGDADQRRCSRCRSPCACG